MLSWSSCLPGSVFVFFKGAGLLGSLLAICPCCRNKSLVLSARLPVRTCFITFLLVRGGGLLKPGNVMFVLSGSLQKPGSSALSGALDRSYRAEVGLLTGQTVACLLWDFSKCFDRLLPTLLIACALRLGFPLVDLKLGLQMHFGARRLLIIGCVGPCMFPLAGVLPGCGLAIPFTRLYLYFEMDLIHTAIPHVRLGSMLMTLAKSVWAHARLSCNG